MTETKTILLIGRTGRGKSTLANVITNTNDFKEGKLGVSETKEIQTEKFKNDNFDYLIIDNPGIGDTKLPTEKILDTIAEAVYLVRDGVSRVFFVTDGRFAQHEMATYNLLRAVIFDQEITKNTTIIRTRFKDFKKTKKREEDIESMIKVGGELAEIIKSCEKRVIHVNNPPIVIAPIGTTADEESKEDRIKREKEIELNKKARKKSREILLNHLSENCQTNSYKPPKLQELSDEIIKFMEGKKKLEEDLKNISKKKIRKLRNKRINDSRVKNVEDSTENISKKNKATAEQEKERINDNQDSNSKNERDNNNIEKEIKNLEDARKELKEEVEKKENIIRQKVFKHIFNNYGDLKKVLGSDIFISSIIGDDNNDWEKISAEFTNKKLILEWKGQGFNYQQTQEWVDALKNSFNPEYDAGFCAWLRDNKHLTVKEILSANIEKLKSEYRHQLQSDNRELEIKLNLKNQQNWQLLNIIQRLKEDFPNWTSGNSEIDKFIQECQSKARSYNEILEWIPYEKFNNIEHIADGGFGKVYKAEWEEGSIEEWNNEKKQWKRKEYGETVALKTLTNSQNLNQEFLQELTLYKMFRSEDGNIVPCYGVSRDGESNYIMVMEYIPEGNLREYLKKNYQKIDFEDKLYQLYTIAFGLEAMHEKGLVHRDFHSGNILVDGVECYITDLGLSKPADEKDDGNIYGIIPYVAPEVFQRQPYTQKSDIYSLGMIMYEIITGLPPFAEQSHNTKLVLKIIRGERPEFPAQIKYPQLLIDLIKQCWEQEPNNRPTARKISGIVGEWFGEYNDLKKDTKFYHQCQEAEEYNKTLPDKIKYPTYQSPETWHSKLINTKEITQLLQQKTEECHAGTTEELTLDNLNIQEEPEQTAQIQVPPK